MYFVGEVLRPYDNFTAESFNEELRIKFEENERLFRRDISSRKINYGDFLCKGEFQHWVKVVKILNGIFFCNNEFLFTRSHHLPWSTPFLKYVNRILKTLPNNITIIIDELTRIEKIHHQLTYLNNTVVPYFSLKTTSDTRTLVSKEKLTDLWIHRRNKAIKVINNDGFWCSEIRVNIPVEENKQYYSELNKYVIVDNFEPLAERFFDTNTNDGVQVNLFSRSEIESVITKCPNGRSPGADGVKYEDIKENWQRHSENVKAIFDTILINEYQLPGSTR